MRNDPVSGIVPEGWRNLTIGKACDEYGGEVQTGPFGSQLHAADYVPVGIPSVMPKNLSEDRVSTADIARVRETDAERLAKHRLRSGDIIYSRRGDVERRALIGDREAGWLCGTGCLRIRLNPAEIHPSYLFYFLGHPSIRSYIVRHAQGATMPNLNTSILRNVPLTQPPLDEQKRIAAVLGALDDKIELNRKMNQTLEEMAQAIFKSWFIDFDGVAEEDLEDSELGPIPRGWQITNLGALTDKIGSGATPRGGASVYVNTGVRLIRSQNIYDSEFKWDGLVHLTDSDADKLRGVTVEEDDILINITGDSILRTCIVDPTVLPARVNQHVAIIRARQDIPTDFLHQHLLSKRMKEWLLGHSAGATRKAITKGHLEAVPIIIPPSTKFGEFEKITYPLRRKRNANDLNSRVLTDLRNVLLPKLISGEIRIPAAEESIGEHL